MPTDSEQWIVSLHDGTLVDARIATADLAVLKDLAECNEGLLEKLHAQAQDGALGDPMLAKDLGDVFYAGGRLRPLTRLLLKNSIQAKDGTYQIVDPFEQTEANRVVLETINENKPIFLERLAREVHKDKGDDLFR